MSECLRDGCTKDKNKDAIGSMGRFCSVECYNAFRSESSVSIDTEAVARDIADGDNQ